MTAEAATEEPVKRVFFFFRRVSVIGRDSRRRSRQRFCVTPFHAALDLLPVCREAPFNRRLLARTKMAARARYLCGPGLLRLWTSSPSGATSDTREKRELWQQMTAFRRKRVRQRSAGASRRRALAVWRAHNIRLHSRSQPNVNFIL